MTENNQIYDTVIIGSGPGGLTAAIYNARAELKTVVIAGNMPGGQLTTTTMVENWPGFPKGVGGIKLMMDTLEQVKNWGVEVKNGNVKKILKPKDLNSKLLEIELDNGEILKTKAVIIATGATAKWLELPREKELIGHGISGCATCDGMMFRDKVVAVVGGGNAACEEANFLSKICSKVYLIHRRDELRATPIEAKRTLENKKIEMVWDSVVVEINANLQPLISSLQNIKIKNVKTGDEKILPIDGLFIAIGRIPKTEFVKDLIELKESGYIKVGSNEELPSMTSVEGIFAAGDCMDERHRQAIIAAGAGARAAIDAERWLNNRD
ncbi:MAG TPA: thioredoxin-disulfide reductase [Candidatus Woesebacteria bacterium]|nr:thioredoxin-disulfide reductase [Candidatus Woesebacteria bacterium]HOY61282.1 thioredoxin-disulfide reductase [Candidatus Woesebacteria bacterium]HPR99366.1 thioredoxin-disulfide reductase [Candidatus Woesebacteria bacterium]